MVPPLAGGEFAATLRTLLVPHTPPNKCANRASGTPPTSTPSREELLLTARAIPRCGLSAFLPRCKRRRKRAGILALHGTAGTAIIPWPGDDLEGVANAIKSANYDYAGKAVQRG